jgi:hypothetical protein
MAKLYDYRTQEYREMKEQAEMQGAKEGKQCRCNEGTWCMQAAQAAHHSTKDDAPLRGVWQGLSSRASTQAELVEEET